MLTEKTPRFFVSKIIIQDRSYKLILFVPYIEKEEKRFSFMFLKKMHHFPFSPVKTLFVAPKKKKEKSTHL